MAKGYDAKPSEFSFVGPYLTTSAQKLWATQVLAALTNRKDTRAPKNVSALTTWSIGEPYTFRKGQVHYTDGTYHFTPGNPAAYAVTVAGQEQLVLHFTATRNLRVIEGGKAVLVALNKDVTYQMVPNGLEDHPWLINAWKVNWSLGKATPDPNGVKD